LKSKAICLGLVLFFLSALLLGLSPYILAGPKLKHVVAKGDNLWSICQRYYNDPWIWPELWEMNQFITNPHWIKPGEIITLYDYEMLKAKAQKKIVAQKKVPQKETTTMGLDVSCIINTRALGFLQLEREQPWGTIFDHESERIVLDRVDIVYVKMHREGINPGDKFTIYNISLPIISPVTEKECGYIHFFKGILEIKKAQKGYYIAQITESFQSIAKNDLLIPYYPVSSCILPLPCQGSLTAHIVAAKDNLHLLGQRSVAYIDAGRTKGIMTGNLFEVIEERESAFDLKRKEKVALPPAVLGRMLILQTRENTATGVICWASRDFTIGSKIRSYAWDEQLKEFTLLPPCPIQ
jgi:hypothetical protein